MGRAHLWSRRTGLAMLVPDCREPIHLPDMPCLPIGYRGSRVVVLALPLKSVGAPDHAWHMFFDPADPLDPLNPLAPLFWSDWMCPDCSEDGDKADLVDGHCPNCGGEVDRLP